MAESKAGGIPLNDDGNELILGVENDVAADVVLVGGSNELTLLEVGERISRSGVQWDWRS